MEENGHERRHNTVDRAEQSRHFSSEVGRANSGMSGERSDGEGVVRGERHPGRDLSHKTVFLIARDGCSPVVILQNAYAPPGSLWADGAVIFWRTRDYLAVTLLSRRKYWEELDSCRERFVKIVHTEKNPGEYTPGQFFYFSPL